MPGTRPLASYHPTRTARHTTIGGRGTNLRGQLQTSKSRGDNVKSRRDEQWPDEGGFDENTDNKRRRTTIVTGTQPRVVVQARAVDLTRDEHDAVQFVGKQEAQIRSMLPPPSSSPNRLSNKSHSLSHSQKSARSQTSIANSFGSLQEYRNVSDRVDSRRSRRNVLSGATARLLERRRDTEPIDLDDRASHAAHDAISNGSDGSPNQTLSKAQGAGFGEDVAIFEDDDAASPDVMEMARFELPRTGKLKANGRNGLRVPQDPYAQANARYRASLGSEDELATDGSRAASTRIASRSGTSQRLNNHDSREQTGDQDPRPGSGHEFAVLAPVPDRQESSAHDMHRSEFINSDSRGSVARELDRSSGWRFNKLYSNLSRDGVFDTNLHSTRDGYGIRRGSQRKALIYGSRIRKATYSSNKLALEGLGDSWAIIDFCDTPMATGFRAKLRKDFPRIEFVDLGSKSQMGLLFQKILQQHAANASEPARSAGTFEEPRSESKRPARQTALEVSVLPDVLGRPSQRSRPTLISQMIGDDHDDEVPERQSISSTRPSGSTDRATRRVTDQAPAAPRVRDNDLLQLHKEGAARRSLRNTRRSHYFELPDDQPLATTVPDDQRYSKTVGLGDPWPFSLTYPLVGKDRATVEWQDLERLDDGEFLNDNLIEFYLRWARQQQLEKGNYREGQVHFFNTFFYEKLSNSGRTIDHKAVETWTRKVNIFDIDYVVVPVNESSHWYVCIICNLPNLLRPAVTDLTNDDEVAHDQKSMAYGSSDLIAQLTAAADESVGTIPNESTHDGLGAASNDQLDTATESFARSNLSSSPKAALHSPAIASQDSLSLTHDDGVFKDAKLSSPKASRGKRRRSGPAPRKYDPGTTIIITLDSLGLTHSKTTGNLKDYIIAEAEARLKLDIKREDIKGMNVTRGIPQQQNFCDCGVFLLGYVHAFLSDPRRFVNKILSNEMDAEADWPDMDPKNLRANVRETIQKTYADQLPERLKMRKKKRKLPTLNEPRSGAKGPAFETAPSVTEPSSPARVEAHERDINEASVIELNPPDGVDVAAGGGEQLSKDSSEIQTLSSIERAPLTAAIYGKAALEDVMLLDNQQADPPESEAGAPGENGSPMDLSDQGAKIPPGPTPHTRESTHKTALDLQLIDEIPDSQDLLDAQPQSRQDRDGP